MAALILKDRVLETSTTTGTGTLTLAGAVTGYQAFSAIGDANTCYYYAEDVDANGVPNGGWEIGLGTYTLSGTTLARTTILASSNSGSAVNWSAGTRRIGVFELPASMVQYPKTETDLTADTTLVWGKSYSASPTSAGITLTLPTAVGHKGERIRVRITQSATKLVTVDGNASETLDGTLTRIMWTGEAAELQSDGTNVTKVAGVSIPMKCLMTKVADQGSIAGSTETLINLDTATYDNTGLMADTTNHKIVAKRPGQYRVEGFGRWNALAVASRVLTEVYLNGSVFTVEECSASGATGNYSAQTAGRDATLALSDYIELKMFHNNAAAQTALCGNPAGCYASMAEVTTW